MQAKTEQITTKDLRQVKDISIMKKQLLLLIFGLLFHFLIYKSSQLVVENVPSFIQYILECYTFLTVVSYVLHIKHKVKLATEVALFTSVLLLPVYLHLALLNVTFTLIGFGAALIQTYSLSRIFWKKNQNSDSTLSSFDDVQISYRRIDDLFTFSLFCSLSLCYIILRFPILESLSIPINFQFNEIQRVFSLLITQPRNIITIIFLIAFLAYNILNIYIENIRLERFTFKKIFNPKYFIFLLPLFLIGRDCYYKHLLVTHLKLIFVILTFRLLWINIRLWLKNGGFQKFWTFFINRPAILLTASFFIVITLGTLLLTLPFMFKSNIEPLAFVDCIFIATSATCVTGLSTCNVAETFSIWGQLVLVSMVQIGGLGLMTISIFIAMILKKDIGLRGSFSLGEMIGEQHCRTAQSLLKSIIGITIIIEALGVLILMGSYKHFHQLPWLESLHMAVFHAISAFCNAGFSIHQNGLINIHPAIGLILSGLIIAGGLGFSVHYAFIPLFQGHRVKFNQHIKVILAATSILFIGGTLVIMLSELFNSHSPSQGFFTQLYHAWFMSVSCRTAGFNTIDLNFLSNATWIFLMFLMFIGAAPGSTGGGIKVTTFIVLLATVRSFFKGEDDIILFGRRVSSRSLIAAISLLLISFFLILVFSVILSIFGFNAEITQNLTIKNIFLCISAYGTVGLDLDLCGHLTIVGKFLLCFLMFIGRIGPLTLLLILKSSNQKTTLHYPSDNIMIG